jgi:hypothetical protein
MAFPKGGFTQSAAIHRKETRTAMTTSSLPLPHDFGDRFSPIVVKELRQGLRTRFFTTTLLLFHSCIILLLVTALATPVEVVNGVFWGIAGLVLLVVLPLRAFNALHAEATDGTLDMLTLTSIASFRILHGKWVALFSQSVLVAGSLLPYMVARYFFGGVEILREAVALLVLALGSGIITAALLAFSSQASVILRLLLLVGVGLGAVPLGFFTAFLVSVAEADRMLREFFALAGWEQWSIILGFLALSVYLIWYFLALGSSRIAPPSENHSTRKRVIVFGVHAALMSIGLLLCYLSRDAENAAWALIPLIGLTLITCMDLMTEQMPCFPTTVAALARRGRFGSLAGRLLHPGWASGVLFSALLCLMALVLIAGITHQETGWDWDDGPGIYMFCLVLAAFTPVLVRINRTNIFANWWVVQLCMVAVGILLVMFCEVMRARDFAMLGVLTPVTTLFGAETVSYQSRKSIMIAGSFFSVMWLIAALIRARMHFADYTRLEHEALTLADHSPHRAHDVAQ